MWPLGHVASARYSSANDWTVDHPQTLFAWEGACIRIPCKYKTPLPKARLDNILLFQNYEFDKATKKFTGTVLYNATKTEKDPESELYLSKQGRVTFLGNRIDNCTLKIHLIHANDSGNLGLRMTAGTERWMEPIHLNVSGKAWGDSQLF